MIAPRQRATALLALLIATAVLVLAGAIAVENFPSGLVVLAGVAIAVAAAWYGLRRRGVARVVGVGIALVGMAASVIMLLASIDNPLAALAFVAGLIAFTATARMATNIRASLPDTPAPAHPVLFYNPKSGGGKAERFNVAVEAKARGIRPIELTRGADLEQLVRAAVAEGADGLAMAGGDGSQAVVASVASELDLPYACIPSGTRNHFALDLGVDRDDVVGALDAFVDGGERRVDLAEVNGRVFVNNVSLGLYAEAVQQPGYRDAKLRTMLDTIPDTIGPGQEGLDLRWTGPGGHQHSSGAVILVSNNSYRLGHAIGSGTRPHIDEGLLGVSIASAPTGRGGRSPQRPLRAWSTAEFEVDSDEAVHAGIDGEAVTLSRRFSFGSGQVYSGCASPARTRGSRHRRGSRRASGRASAACSASRAAATRRPPAGLNPGERGAGPCPAHGLTRRQLLPALDGGGGRARRGRRPPRPARGRLRAGVGRRHGDPRQRGHEAAHTPASSGPPGHSHPQLPMPRSRSFPSGHSAAAFAFSVGVGRALPAAAPPLVALATLVSYSRIHTGVHYTSDVVAGALCGIGLAEATVRLIERQDY